jgi:flagellar biosynthetic protein FlhB
VSESEDKKHDPSERRLREAAERGELPRSTEVNGVASTMAVATALTLGASAVAWPITKLGYHSWSPGLEGSRPVLDLASAQELLQEALLAVAGAAMVPLGAAAAAAVVVGMAQTRFQIAPQAFSARLEHLDPLATFQKIFLSRQPLVEFAKGSLHVLALGAVTAVSIARRADTLPRTAALPPSTLLGLLVELGWELVVTAIPVMIALAAIDYGWSTFTWWQSMMRSDHEAKEENKEQEGDPHVKAMRRRRARELATRNAFRQLQEADVLVTNPTHFAVGLRYRHGVDQAPVVVVKAVDHLAVKLRQEAFALGIPRVEDRLLARTLHAQVPRGRAVPASLFGPVARVLAVVYRRRGRKMQGRSPTSAR